LAQWPIFFISDLADGRIRLCDKYRLAVPLNDLVRMNLIIGQINLLNLAHLFFDQLGDFSLLGKSLSFNIFFREDQLAATFYIEDTATAFDQFNF